MRKGEGEREVGGGVRRQERAVWTCVLIDLATMVPTVAVAVLSGSVVMLSDVADYGKSFVANAVALRILRRIRRGEIREYDYGAGKMEQIGSIFGSLCFLGGLAGLGIYAFHRLLHPVPLDGGFAALGMGVQAASMAVNGCLWRRHRRLARETRAPLMEAQWRHNRTDALGSLAVFLALGLTVGLRRFSWAMHIDPACALVYVFAASGTYGAVLRDAFRDLLDETLAEDLQIKIMRRLAKHYDGYETFHGVRSRRSGNRMFIEIALGFDPERPVGEATDTAESLRAGIEADIPLSEVSVVLKPMERLRLARDERTDIQILPLSPSTLEPALALIESTFRLRPDENPRAELEESLRPGSRTQELANICIETPRYWVAFHQGQVLGVAGLNGRPEDRHEAVWGGWAVYADERRGGLSRARFLMLKKLLAELKASGKTYFRLDTTTDPVSKSANHFYDRMGLTVYKTEERGEGHATVLYRQAKIEHLAATFDRRTAKSRSD